MNVKMEYPWYQTMPFILFTALFWILVIPIPMTVYLILKRLEKKQLSRLIIAKILGIDYYREEISQMTQKEYSEKFQLEFDISEQTFQLLNKQHEELRKEYDTLIFKKILDEKVASQRNEENVESPVLTIDELIKDSEEEKKTLQKENEKFHRKERVKPKIMDNRIYIDENDLFNDDDLGFF